NKKRTPPLYTSTKNKNTKKLAKEKSPLPPAAEKENLDIPPGKRYTVCSKLYPEIPFSPKGTESS
ncbi:MAG: hypothetical protein IJB15_01925, partial [Clostridia bacterium]|nr:hypothetical protein [Clostridia bacterium]